MSGTGIRRLKICQLGPDSSCFFLVGIIIRKQEAREITSKKENFSKSVFGFTIRDSPSDYMNVNVWGSTEYVTYVCSHFQVGDVVDIIDPKVSFRRTGDFDEKYSPVVTSSFILTINEKRSEIYLHDSSECGQFISLLHLPTKPIGSFFKLDDIYSNSNLMKGDNANLLVAVRNVGERRKLTSQTGKDYESREIVLMDHTGTLTLQIWDAEISKMADAWTPRKTVLFIADAKIEWNKFRRSIIARVTNCTVITVDPLIPEAENLKKYALTAPIKPLTMLESLTQFHNPSDITTVMSCHGILSKSMENHIEGFTAVLYAIIHLFDIDGCSSVMAYKCSTCGIKLSDGSGICANSECLAGSGLQQQETEICFDIRISFIDHTGALPNCRINDLPASNFLKCKAVDFAKLTPGARTELKWRYLLKPCVAKMFILASNEIKNPLFSVVDIQQLSLVDYSSNLPMH